MRPTVLTDMGANNVPLPERGMNRDELFKEVLARKAADAKWEEGRTFSLIYPTGRQDVDDVLMEANRLYLYENALNPGPDGT